VIAGTELDFLTQEEQDWIKSHPVINVSPQLSHVQDIYLNWNDTIQAIKSKQTDVVPYLYLNKSLENDLVFTSSYFNVNEYLYTLDMSNFKQACCLP